MSSIDAFFAFARERHSIYLRRRSSPDLRPLTTDWILQQYRFTNVFRELDRTTVWYRENVREPIMDEPMRHWHQLLLATVVFRWFNRITTGEAIWGPAFGHGGEFEGETAWDAFTRLDDVGVLRAAILEHCGDGPYVTGSYIIKTPDGSNKLDGVLQCIKWFMEQEHEFVTPQGDRTTADCRKMAEWLVDEEEPASLESVWLWLKQFPFLGDFMAYEIVTDLRHSIMRSAPDIMTWANPGPGATRGIGRVLWGDKDVYNQHRDKTSLIRTMQELLEHSTNPKYWPQRDSGVEGWHDFTGLQKTGIYGEVIAPLVYTGEITVDEAWPTWEMRDVEHTLCEFDKYERVRTGEGTPRGRFA